MTAAHDAGETRSATTAEPPAPSRRRRSATLTLLLALLACAFVAAIALGSVRLAARDVWTVLAGGAVQDASAAIIVRELRLPRAIGAVLAGAGLALSGLWMQTLFRNPLAGPFVLGIDAGASLGIALVVLTAGPRGLDAIGAPGELGRILAAWIGAGGVLLLVLAAARSVREPVTLLILGLMVGYFVNALVSVLLSWSDSEQLRTYVSWTFGSFRGITWEQLASFAPSVGFGVALGALLVKPANAMLLGENYARTLGVPVERVRWLLVLSASILAGTVTAFCGPVAFLGVAVPHLARGLLGTSDHRVLAPAVLLLGANVALVADLLSRLPGREESLPLSAVTSLLGAPVLLWVVLRQRSLAL